MSIEEIMAKAVYHEISARLIWQYLVKKELIGLNKNCRIYFINYITPLLYTFRLQI